MQTLRPEIRATVNAALDKKAEDVTVLDLSRAGAFAETFVLCSGQSTPQLRAIADAIEEALDRFGVRLAHREGKAGAEWVLLDYGFFVAHIFSPRAREYYDLERLWRNAERVDFSISEKSPEPNGPEQESSSAGGVNP